MYEVRVYIAVRYDILVCQSTTASTCLCGCSLLTMCSVWQCRCRKNVHLYEATASANMDWKQMRTIPCSMGEHCCKATANPIVSDLLCTLLLITLLLHVYAVDFNCPCFCNCLNCCWHTCQVHAALSTAMHGQRNTACGITTTTQWLA